MALTVFNPNETADADEVNENFNGIADGTEIEDDAILARHIETQESWVAPSLLNSWADLDGGTTYTTVGYMKDSLGFVHLKGLAKDGTPSSTSVMFTLPAGYRPNKRSIITTVSNNALGQVRVWANGDVVAHAGSSTWFSLDGITFKGEQ